MGPHKGGVISPILSNIFLDKLDKYVEQALIPELTRGTERTRNPEYDRLRNQARWNQRKGNYKEARELEKQYQSIPSKDPNDPSFRRLRYVRYADDFLLSFVGPRAEAEEIKEKLAAFLHDQLKLELSASKTLITHAATDAARFLGYDITTRYCDTKHDHRGHRCVNSQIELRIPAKVIEERCALYMRDGKAIHRTELVRDDDYTITSHYQSEYRGYVQYYQLADNIAHLGKLRWIMETSLLKTLAHKHKKSVSEISKKHQVTMQTADGPRKCLMVTHQRNNGKPLVAYFGGIPLRRKRKTTLKDQITQRFRPERAEILQRLLAQVCEICGATERLQVHHIRKLADLKTKGRGEKPLWVQMMSIRNRKTLVLCQSCHTDLHAGRLNRISNGE